MSSFEEYLLFLGYERMQYDFQKKSNVPVHKPQAFSTYGPVDYRYVKRGCPVIYYGLFEVGFPPTLIYPLPYSYVLSQTLRQEGIRDCSGGIYSTRLMQLFDAAEIESSICQKVSLL